MSYDFKRLAEIDSVEEFPAGASVIIESEGAIKRCPADGLGSGSAMIITDSDLTFLGAIGPEVHPYMAFRINDELYDAMKNAFPMVAFKFNPDALFETMPSALNDEGNGNSLIITPIAYYVENMDGLTGFMIDFLGEGYLLIVNSSFVLPQ